MILNWNFVKDALPEKDGEYAVAVKLSSGYTYLTDMLFATGADGGWNCHRDCVTGEMVNDRRINLIYAWAELAPVKAMEQKELDELNAMMKDEGGDAL